MSLLAISDTHKREKAILLATKSPTFGSHLSVNGHVPNAQEKVYGIKHICFMPDRFSCLRNGAIYELVLQYLQLNKILLKGNLMMQSKSDCITNFILIVSKMNH